MDWKKKVNGYIPSKADPRDYKMKLAYGAEELPEEYNVDVKHYVHDQGEINNCAAHALSTFVEIFLDSLGKFQKVSYPWYYGNRRYTENQEEGLIARDLLKTAQKDGGLYLSDYPLDQEVPEVIETFNNNYEAFKDKAQNLRIANYYSCTTVEEVKEAVMKYGAVLIGTYLFESFGAVATGQTLYMNEPIITGNTIETPVGGHMMIITGWIKDYFIVQNSWGGSFGDKGTFFMPFSLATWNQRTGFPINVFEAWAIDGMYIDGQLVSFNSEIEEPIEPEPTPTPEPTPEPEPEEPVEGDGWVKEENGKFRYYKDGYYVIGKWMIDDNDYYFDHDGYMLTDYLWEGDDSKWYCINNKGVQIANCWYIIDGRKYFFDEDGAAVQGFREIDGKNYYFAEFPIGGLNYHQLLITDENGVIQ